MVAGVILFVLVATTTAFAIVTAVPESPPPIRPTTPELPDRPIPRKLGAYLFERLLQDEWIHRRAESITFLGWDRVRRRVSLDIETLEHTPDLKSVEQAVDSLPGPSCCIVPLAYVRKGESGHEAEFRAFEARAADGRRLPILGRRDHQLATLALLVHAVERLADSETEPPRVAPSPASLTPHELEALWALVASPLPEAQNECDSLLARIQRSDPRLQTMVSAWGAVDDTTSPAERGRVTARQGVVKFLLRMLSTHSILLADLGVQSRAMRHVLEFVSESGAEDRRPPPRTATAIPRQPLGVAAQRARRAWSIWKVRLGWAGVRVDLATWATLPCESHHLEVEAPDQMVITRARTFVYDGQDLKPEDDMAVLMRPASLAHVRQPGIPPMSLLWGAVEFDATADHRGGWLAFLAAGVMAGLLALGFVRPRSIHQADAAATILVLVPGILLTAAAADVRHASVREWRSLFIPLVVVVGMISLAAAASIVSVPDDPVSTYRYPTRLWFGLLCATSVISLCLLRSNLVKLRRRRR